MAELTNPTWFRSGKNLTGSTILAKRFIAPDGTTPGQIRLPAAVTTWGEGVTTEDIPDGFTGSYQRDGIAVVTCSAAVNAGAFVQSGTDGRAATAATNSQIRGVARNTTVNPGDDLEVELWSVRAIAP